jgi:hypothetical protein
VDWDDVDEICMALRTNDRPADLRGMTDDEIVSLVRSLSGFVGSESGYDVGHLEGIRAGTWWGI